MQHHTRVTGTCHHLRRQLAAHELAIYERGLRAIDQSALGADDPAMADRHARERLWQYQWQCIVNVLEGCL